MKVVAHNLDKIFYFVSPENLQLKSDKENEIVAIIADVLGVSVYAMRSGPGVQDSGMLLNELVDVGIEKFEIIYFEKEISKFNTGERNVVFLGYDDKVDFMKMLNCEPINNSGLICQKLLFEK